MSHSATDKDLYYTAYDPNGSVRHTGITPMGQETVSGLPLFISAETEEEFLRKNDGLAFDPLPAQGEEILRGALYMHGALLVVCRQTHKRTEHDPADIPALFSIYQEPQAGEVLDWIAGEWVGADVERMHGGEKYKVIQPHQTQEGWEPDTAIALWTVVTAGIPEWVQPTGGHDAYNTGDEVMFPDANGTHYRSLIDANVWSPTAYPAGWEVV